MKFSGPLLILLLLCLFGNSQVTTTQADTIFAKKSIRLVNKRIFSISNDTTANSKDSSAAITEYAAKKYADKKSSSFDSTKYFRLGGNSFGVPGAIGTKDNKELRFLSFNTNHLTLGTDGTFYSPTNNWSFNTDNSFQLGSNAGFSPSGDVKIPHNRFLNFAQNDGEVGKTGFGIWDSAGKIMWKDSLGEWKSITSSSLNLDTNRIAFKEKTNIFTGINTFTNYSYFTNNGLNIKGSVGGMFFNYNDGGLTSFGRLHLPTIRPYPTFDTVAYRSYVDSINSLKGTVNSVGLTVPTGFAVSGSPITDTGTFALSFASGYSLPLTADQTNWNTAYTNRITSLTTTGSSGAASLTSNVLNIPNYTLSGLGGEPSITASNTTKKYWTGYKTWGSMNSDSLTEGSTNLFHTDARSRAAISLTTTGTSGAAVYNSSTGVLNIPQYSGTTYSAGRGLNLTSTTFSLDTTKGYTWTGNNNYTRLTTFGNDVASGNKFRIAYSVASNSFASFYIGSDNTFRIVPATAATSQFVVTKTDGTTSLFHVDGTNLRCGINTSSPSYNLHVVNTSSFGTGSVGIEGQGGVGGALTFVKASGGATNDAIGQVLFSNNGTTRARIRSLQADGTNDNGNLVFGVTTSGGSITDRLTITTGGETQLVGNLNLTTAGNKIKVATGSNASIGTSGAMTAGTITISTTAVTNSSKIFLTHASVGGTVGVLSVGTITNATSFVINSSSALDTSTVNWWIIN